MRMCLVFSHRMKLSMKESEMDELKSELELRKSSSHKKSPDAAVENLKKELQSVVDRNKAGLWFEFL